VLWRAGATTLYARGSYPPQIVLKFQHRRKLKDLRVEEFEMGFGEDKKIEDGRDGYFWS
jgi:hypothetical protein